MKEKPSNLSVAFLYDDTLDSTDGVSQYVKTVGSWLSSNGAKVTYLVGDTQIKSFAGSAVISLAKNVRVSFNGNKLSMPIWSSKRKIRKVLVDNHFDVIHVQVPYSPLMAARVIKLASKNTAIVGTFHILPLGLMSRFGGKLLSLYLRRNSRRITSIVSVSSAAADFARDTFGLSGNVIPNTIDESKLLSVKKNELGKIVFLGRLVERKGCRQLLEAFRLLAERVPEARLSIAGRGPLEKSLKEYASRSGLEKKVEFLGYVAEEDKADLLASASVACFPSLGGESFGIVLIEAMAAGAGVVIGGNNPGYASVLGEKPELLIDPGNANDFAASLEKMLTDKKLAVGLHAWQQQLVKQYDVNTVGERLLELYSRAIDIKKQNEHNKH